MSSPFDKIKRRFETALIVAPEAPFAACDLMHSAVSMWNATPHLWPSEDNELASLQMKCSVAILAALKSDREELAA